MVTEIYVIGSIILSMIVVGLFFFGSKHPSSLDDINAAFQCPRCGAIMEESGGSILGGIVYFFVPPPLVLTCPQCGYSERSWNYRGKEKWDRPL